MSTQKKQASQIFTEMIIKNIAPKSQSLYYSTINRFKTFLSEYEYPDLLSIIDSELFDEFINYLNCNSLQYKTIHNYEGALITLINYANNDRKIKANINISTHKRVEDHRSREQKKSKQIPLSEEQLYKIYNLQNLSIKEQEARDLFICQCLLGQRISDMPKIFRGDYTIQLTKDNTEIISFCVQKTGEEATLYLFPIARQIIDRYRHQGFRYFDIFNNDEKNFKHLRNLLNTTIKSVCKKADLTTEQNYATQIGKKIVIQRQKLYQMIHTQTARHTFITLMCKLGVPKENVTIATAHTDTKMIENVYLHETVCERGQRLIGSYREIKESHFFFVEKKPSLRPNASRLTLMLTKLLTKLLNLLTKP